MKSYREIRQFFHDLHDVKVNQKYDKTLPYSFHLDMVEKQFKKFEHLLENTSDRVIVSKAVFAHDSMEDARLTYNDVKALLSEEVAEIVYLCTDYKGRTRRERKPVQFYMELSQNKLAVFVKLCDVMANVKYSLLSNSSMFDKYKEEYSKYKGIIHIPEYDQMFIYLESIFALPQNNIPDEKSPA